MSILDKDKYLTYVRNAAVSRMDQQNRTRTRALANIASFKLRPEWQGTTHATTFTVLAEH